MYFCYFVFISPLEHLKKFESPSPKDAMCLVWFKIGPLVLEKILKFCQCIFAILLSYPFGEGCASSFDKLKSSSPKSVLCQLWLKLVYCFWRRFSDLINVFLLFNYYLPLEQKCDPFPRWNKVWPFIWRNVNSLLNKDAYAKFHWHWPSGSWEEDFHIWLMYFHYYIIISPWKRGGGASFEQIWIPFTQGCFVPSLIEISPMVLEKTIFKFC